jgi:hypothetical protein
MSNTERDERGWGFSFGEFYNSASRQAPGQTIDVEVEPEGMGIRVDEGRGYCAQTTNAYVPMDVVIRLIERAGYTVTRS